jgi:hypothetical protein
VVEPERIADRHHVLAHLEIAGTTERRRGQVRTVDLNDRHVEANVATDDLAGKVTTVDHADGDALGVLDDVRVGQDQTARVVHHA